MRLLALAAIRIIKMRHLAEATLRAAVSLCVLFGVEDLRPGHHVQLVKHACRPLGPHGDISLSLEHRHAPSHLVREQISPFFRLVHRRPPMSTFGTSVILHYRDQELHGFRTAESRISPLKVLAAPWNELGRLLEGGLPPNYGIYFLTGPLSGGRLAVRPGEASDLRRRLLEHAADPTKSGFAEVYAVTSVDNRLGKADCRFLEARAHEVIAQEPSRVLEVERMPAVLELPSYERDDLEGLFAQARTLLHAVGCRALDAKHLLADQPTPPSSDEGVVEVQPNFSGMPEDEHELVYDSLWARGYPSADGGFVVRAGSDIRVREGAALLPGISNRRRLLADRGVLGTLPGITDRWRLLSNVYCSSPLLAAKIVTGAHLSRVIWQRISPDNRLLMAR